MMKEDTFSLIVRAVSGTIAVICIAWIIMDTY